ncbi:MFS transporter [Luteolibacter luteus]|uniref:MFS transporter n=1 Tax=Luteolibacter luteus TaxID=2728835 RepID=A0A858RHW0_9BACT|nr:MFS transporter [Luteolibacter luteus]QJE96134.1 MFS transporter [Luteolibacter luteus]
MEAKRTIGHNPDTIAASPPPFSLQTRMVVLTYLAYFFYYLTRKHLGVATHALTEDGFSEKLIAAVQTGYGACYAIGQFMSGALGDRIGPRIGLSLGMILSAIATLAFGIFPFVAVLAICFTLNGLFQATGWPNCCKVVTLWVSHAKRGRVMGFWLTCYIFGSLAANMIAGYILEHYGWRQVFLFTGVTVLLVGIIQGLFLINTPEDAGYSFGEDAPEIAVERGRGEGFSHMIREPAVLLLGFSYTGLKFVRYAFFAWLPYYLATAVGMSDGNSAYVSNGFEIGGVLGLLIGGIVADRFFPNNRCRLAFLALIGMVAALVVYRMSSASSGLWGNVAGLAVIGFFLYIADAIISGTAAQDIGGSGSAASAAGIINGIGSTSMLFAGMLPIAIKDRWGWDGVFVCFIILGVISSAILLPLALREKVGRAA